MISQFGAFLRVTVCIEARHVTLREALWHGAYALWYHDVCLAVLTRDELAPVLFADWRQA